MGVPINCVSNLFQSKTEIDITRTTDLALLEMLRRSSSSEGDFNGAVKIPIKGIPIGFSIGNKHEFFSTLSSSTSLGWSESSETSIATQGMSRNQVEAFKACLRGSHTSGVRVIAYNSDNKTVTIRVLWIAPVNAPDKAKSEGKFVKISGGTTSFVEPKTWKSGEAKEFVVKRTGKQDINVTANIGGDADSVEVAYIPKVSVEVRSKEYLGPNGSLFRVANGGDGQPDYMNDSVRPSLGWLIDPSSAVVKIDVRAGNITFVSPDTAEGMSSNDLRGKSYARVIARSFEKCDFEAHCYPHAKEGGGDIQFSVSFDEFRLLVS